MLAEGAELDGVPEGDGVGDGFAAVLPGVV